MFNGISNRADQAVIFNSGSLFLRAVRSEKLSHIESFGKVFQRFSECIS